MENNLYREAKAIVQDILDVEDKAQWPQMVQELCGDNSDLRQYVEEWLAAEGYEPVAVKRVFNYEDHQVGCYYVGRQISSTDFSHVYKAVRQSPYRQDVVIKFVSSTKPDLADAPESGH